MEFFSKLGEYLEPAKKFILPIGLSLLVWYSATKPTISADEPKLFSNEWVQKTRGEIGIKPKKVKCKKWGVQVVAYKNKRNLDKVVKSLNKEGYGTKTAIRNGYNVVFVEAYEKPIANWVLRDIKINKKVRDLIDVKGAKVVHFDAYCEVYKKDDLGKIVNYFAEKAGVDKKLAGCITKNESAFNPSAIACIKKNSKYSEIVECEQYKEIEYYAYKRNSPEKMILKKRTVPVNIFKNNKNIEVSAIGLMQVHPQHRNGYEIKIHQYFNPVINAYIGIDLIKEAVDVVKKNKRKKKLVEDVALIYNAGPHIYKLWNKKPKQEQTRQFVNDVKKCYNSR